MRIRRKKWAVPELEKCSYYIKQPEALKGNWSSFFGNENPIYLELGCGKCVFTSKLSAENPNINIIGIDISKDILGVARRNIESEFIKIGNSANNIALVAYDIENISNIFSKNDSIDRLYINFCNPWSKARNHKRRLTYPLFLNKYKLFMKKGAELRFKTDDDDLYLATLRYFSEASLKLTWSSKDIHNDCNCPLEKIFTEHEMMFTSQGIRIKGAVAVF